jgi:hypothetical protein
MTKDEALKLALKALEIGLPLIEDFGSTEQLNAQHKAITAIKEALAQPEQEPLEYWNAVEGWVKIDEVREHFDSVGCGTIYKTAGEGREPLYTTPPQRSFDYKEHAEGLQRDYDLLLAEYNDLKAQRTWTGLTDEDFLEACQIAERGNYLVAFQRIQAKLKEKNNV